MVESGGLSLASEIYEAVKPSNRPVAGYTDRVDFELQTKSDSKLVRGSIPISLPCSGDSRRGAIRDRETKNRDGMPETGL